MRTPQGEVTKTSGKAPKDRGKVPYIESHTPSKDRKPPKLPNPLPAKTFVEGNKRTGLFWKIFHGLIIFSVLSVVVPLGLLFIAEHTQNIFSASIQEVYEVFLMTTGSFSFLAGVAIPFILTEEL